MPTPTVKPVGGGITLMVFCAILIPFTALFVGLRLWSRHLLRTGYQLNDYLILVGSILAIANATLTMLAVTYGGVGYQQSQVLHLYPSLAKITLSLAIVWTLANTFVKLSIIHLYLVVFGSSKAFRRACYGNVFLIIGYCLTNVVQNLLTCRPVAFNWDKTIPGGVCSTQQAPFLASAIINLGIDVIIFASPLPLVWRLHMSVKKKVSLIVIFGFGFLICVLSAVRIHSIATLDYMNFSYSVVPDGIYSVLEPCLGAINACLPVLKPIANWFKGSPVFTTFQKSSQKSTFGESKSEFNPPTIGSGFKKNFKRLQTESTSVSNDDEYPLHDIENGKTNPATRGEW